MTRKPTLWWVALLALLASPLTAEVVFEDPTGDDNGPGSYVYPTDAVYGAGSFDLIKFKFDGDAKKAKVEVTVNTNLDDPWGMDVGFSTQMAFIFIDNAPGGFTEAPPGLNVQFAEGSEWDKLIILSPQQKARVLQEVEAKMDKMAEAVIVPTRTRGNGRVISGSVKGIGGEGDPSTWGFQVVMQSNEGFPADGDLMTRRVNEFEGQHRFGGGNDYMCDPHVMDLLGDQAAQLAHECTADGEATKMATLTMQKAGS
ncbi:MAG: glucodextranase DOMON-like domain-containing protein [Acidobacteriota bacterium]